MGEDPIGFSSGDLNYYRYVFNSPTNLKDPKGKLAWLIPIGLYFAFGDQWLLAPTNENELDPNLGNTPMTELGLCLIAGPEWLAGKEYTWGSKGTRLAPWGNRTGNPYGRFPHYHRTRLNRKGNPKPGQGLKRHRPFEKKPEDRRWQDRF